MMMVMVVVMVMVMTVGVEQDFVIHQEFLIPGVLGGYLECIHFSELIWV